ncbi:MAG: hypothetical protein K2R98_05290 [Gemmataceae bacterium]|nr:hypothetical protein [Gemmataceae bacterium]
MKKALKSKAVMKSVKTAITTTPKAIEPFEIRGVPDDGEIVMEITRCDSPWTEESIVQGINDGTLNPYFRLDGGVEIFLDSDGQIGEQVASGRWTFDFCGLAECY